MDENNIIICEKCYEENENSRTTCKNCGAKLYKRKIAQDNEDIEQEEIKINKNNNNSESNFFHITKGNNIATAVKLIGFIEIICSIILGCILGDTFGIGYRGYNFNGGLCAGIIVAGIIGGIFIIGFGEIIQKLQNIEEILENKN